LQALYDNYKSNFTPEQMKWFGMKDPMLLQKSWKQQKDLYDIEYQDEPEIKQDLMSVPQLRENIAGIEKWIESKKDQPAYESVVYLFTKRLQELKEELRRETEIKEVD
jgi:phage tail tape-measure protein